MKKFLLFLAAGAMTVSFAACNGQKGKNASNHESVEISGAGATFPQPFYNVAFDKYNSLGGDQISYGGGGSGTGIRSLKDHTVDFAGSDAFISDKDMAEMKPVVHVPTCMGAVVLAYNMPEVKNLKLSGDVIADIFAGVIKMWNDPRLQKLNPGVALPAKAIGVVYRSDGSGTTFNFTEYLSKVSPNWKQKYGEGKTVDFPVGQAAKGNPGVAGIISQTPYSLGYIGSEYAFAQKIAYASIYNKHGELVAPSTQSISAAASGTIPPDTRCSITDSDAAGAYPISCFTWLIIYKEQHYDKSRTLAQAEGVVNLLKYMLSDEVQAVTSQIHYAPLPKKAIELSLQNLKTVTFDGKPILK